MASFEPIIVLYGSSKSISSIRLRTPVTFIVATDAILLEELITTDPDLSETCLQRYFVILLESISDDIIERLQSNHRVQVIYSREQLTSKSTSSKRHRIFHTNLQQFTLILTADIVHFLTTEGEKQAKLERLHLTRIYYRQARLLKEWAMSFAKAEPCHILIVPLNTDEKNLVNTVERIENLIHQLGYTSVVIRTLNDYIASSDYNNKQTLLPYAQTLFEHEYPPYIRDLIRRLSPLRLYLYGNEETITSEWSKLMITRETNLMEDEDNWCAFIENEEIDNEIKWNIGTMFGDKWQIKRLTPIQLTDLNKNLRFQSALRRAFKTFDRRQFEITAELFDWYDKCLLDGHLRLEPKLTVEQENKVQIKQLIAYSAYSQCRITNPSPFSYFQNFNRHGPSFIWLDEILNTSNDYLNELIKPFQWNFFSNTFQCLSFIENQIRERKEIFLVLSGSLGCQLFLTENHVLSTVQFVYIYCSRLGFHEYWIQYYAQIQGVFNDLTLLGEKIEENLAQISPTLQTDSITNKTTSDDSNFDQTLISIPITVFDRDQAQAFMSHQRTIDTLLCSPFTSESRAEMIEEFRRIYQDDRLNLSDIENFEQNYHSNNALRWYTRDTFLYRIINQALRSSDVEMMFKMRYFLTDLYIQLRSICTQSQTAHYYSIREKLYRGQRLFRKEFQYFQQLIGQIISINTFLSTTKSLQVALTFSTQITEMKDTIPIVFCITTDSSIQNKRPYGNISSFSAYHDEEEVLFSMGSIFRIQLIENLDQNEHTPIIYLSLIDQTDIYDVNRI